MKQPKQKKKKKKRTKVGGSNLKADPPSKTRRITFEKSTLTVSS